MEIAVQGARHRRFHQGGLPSRHQSRQRGHLMGTNHGGETNGAGKSLQPALMVGVAPGMHQGNGTAAHPLAVVGSQALLEGTIQHQGRHRIALRVKPALHLLHRDRQKGRSLQLKRKQVGAMLVADPEHVRQALVGDQQNVVARSLQQGVGGHGGAKPQLLDGGVI